MEPQSNGGNAANGGSSKHTISWKPPVNPFHHIHLHKSDSDYSTEYGEKVLLAFVLMKPIVKLMSFVASRFFMQKSQGLYFSDE